MRSDDLSKLVLRLTLGILLLMHGIFKVQNGIGGIMGMVASTGLPGWLGYAVYIGEVIAPILLIVGLYSRIAAVLIAINMVVAIALAHSGQLFMVTGNGALKLETQYFFLFTAVAVFFAGAGRFSMNSPYNN
jgi:putative oxidoreductase